MKRLAILAAMLLSGVRPALAVWDSTMGPLQDGDRIRWGNAHTYISGAGNSASAGYVRMGVGDTDAIFVDASGNLGVGAAPTTKLSVTGNANVTGTLAVTGAATFTAPLSSYTVANATGVYTLTTLGTCVSQSTVSLTLPSPNTTIWVSYSGASSGTVANSSATIGVIVDGGYATIGTIAETSTRGILRVGNGTGVAAGQNVNMSFGPLPISGLSTGVSHTLCLALYSSSGVQSLDSINQLSLFTAWYQP